MPTEYEERVRVSRQPFPDQRFTVRELLAGADRVLVAWSWEGTHLGDLPGFPASHRRIATSGATVYYVDAGRLSGHWQVLDRMGIYQQLSGIG